MVIPTFTVLCGNILAVLFIECDGELVLTVDAIRRVGRLALALGLPHQTHARENEHFADIVQFL